MLCSEKKLNHIESWVDTTATRVHYWVISYLKLSKFAGKLLHTRNIKGYLGPLLFIRSSWDQ